MTASETIAAAINRIDEKKEKLKKAFGDLQAHRSLLSPSFSLSWSEIDSHFSSLQTSLSNRFRLLQSAAPLADDSCRFDTADAETSSEATVIRPELRALCETMDGIGLSKFLADRWDDEAPPNLELSAAIRYSPDPASMVLDAIEGSNDTPSSRKSVNVRRKVFVLLMEALIEIDANITVDTRERAKKLAYDWITKIDVKPFEALVFLHLVAAFELRSEFSSEELSDYVFMIAKYKQATWVYNKIGLDSQKVGNLIKKLLDCGKPILAVKFMYECGMTDGFKPTSILRSYIRDSREAAHRLCVEDNHSLNSQNEATDKEVSALKAAIRIIKDQNLESEFSQEKVEERVEELEKQKAQRKRNPQHEPQKKGRKRTRDRYGTQVGVVVPYMNPYLNPNLVHERNNSISDDLSERDQVHTGTPWAALAQKTGKKGEEIAYGYFAAKYGKGAVVRWVNEQSETGLPYDLLIENQGGKIEYVEVKATVSTRKDYFNLSVREWQFANEKGESYIIAHVLLGNSNAILTQHRNPVKLCQEGHLRLFNKRNKQLNKIGSDSERVGNLIKKLCIFWQNQSWQSNSCTSVMDFNQSPYLKSYSMDSREAAHRLCVEDNHSPKSLNEAIDKEVSTLKAVIKIIKDENLESEFSQEKVEKRVEELDKQKALRKRNAANPPPRPEAGVMPAPSHRGLQLNTCGLVNSTFGGSVVPCIINPLAGLYGSALQLQLLNL